MICRQSVRSLAFLRAEWNATLTHLRSVGIDPPQSGGVHDRVGVPVRATPQ